MSKRILVETTDSFSAAHHLPNHPGKCQKLHGHTWKVRVCVEGEVQESGILIDFQDLKDIVKKAIEPLDHNYLNNILHFIPTAENLASYLYDEVRLWLRKKEYDWVNPYEVEVWESDKCSASCFEDWDDED